MTELVIGTVATPQPWRRALQAHVRDHVAGVRLLTLHDARDALAADVDVVVVDDTLDFLTEADARDLRVKGTRVVGVFDPSGRQGRGRRPLDDLRVETALPITAGPEALLDAVATLSPGRRDRFVDRAHAVEPPATDREPSRQGSVVAVSGGSDAPGRTEVAIALAQSLARVRESEPVVLVDLDQRNATIARRLGFQLRPNILDAGALVHAGRPLDRARARRAAFAAGTPDVGFDVIVGLAGPADADGLDDPRALLGALAAEWRWVVVDTGSLHESSPQQAPTAADAIARSALKQADHVVAVASPTPLGVLRLLDWAAASAAIASEMPSRTGRYRVVVNQAPRDRFRRDELHQQITENLPDEQVGDIRFLPNDRAVPDAVWDARPVERGRFAGEVVTIACQIASEPASHRSRRPWRLGGRR